MVVVVVEEEDHGVDAVVGLAEVATVPRTWVVAAVASAVRHILQEEEGT